MTHRRSLARFALVAILVASAASPRAAQSELKLLPSDGALGDEFGCSVCVSAAHVLVGSKGDDDLGFQSGSVYVFDATSGVELRKLLALDGEAEDELGSAVSLSGGLALAGAPGDDDLGSRSGSVYVFDATSGTQLAKLVAANGAADDRFGSSVSSSGSLALVGAYQSGLSSTGSAYVFDATTGTQLAELVSSDLGSDDQFGYSLSIHGGIALVGAPGHDDQGSNSGAAYLFDATTGVQLHELLPLDGQSDDQFGTGVALSGSRALVRSRNQIAGPASGAFYVFDTTSGAQVAKLELPALGEALSLSGTVALGAASDLGQAYLQDTVTGAQITTLTPSSWTLDDELLGASVCLAAGRALVGVPGADDLGYYSGAAYLWSPLSTDTDGISLGAGGAQQLALDTGPPFAGLVYLIAGSASGTSPGLAWNDFGVPLNFDLYSWLTLTGPNLGPCAGTLGVLDASGSALASITLPAGSPPTLAGLALHHAAVVLDATGKLRFASNAQPLTLDP